MNDFFAPAIPADRVLSPALRVHLVDSDGFEPRLKSMRDYVLVAPVNEFAGDGLYILHDGFAPVIYRVQRTIETDRPIRLSLDNPVYRGAEGHGHRWSMETFNDAVLGIVTAEISVRDERFLRVAGMPGPTVNTGEN